MNIIQIFLDKLVKEEKKYTNPINDMESSKNEILEIKNILLKYNNELNENVLLLMDEKDLKRIFEICDDSNVLYDECIMNIKLVKSFKDLEAKYNKFDAPQYESALEWLKEICVKINNFVNNFCDDNEKYKQFLEEKANKVKEYLKLFKNNKLIKPVLNIEDFLNYIDNMSFSLEDKIELKSEIGKMNSKLITKKGNEKVINKYDKYLTVLKNKKEKYKDIYDKIKDEKISIDTFSDDIKTICKNYKLDKKDTCECGIAILLEKELKNKKGKDIEYFENILDLTITDEKIEQKENDDLDKEILDEVNSIIEKEKRIIKNISEDELNSFLAQSINLNDEKAINYKIMSVLTALYSEAEKFKNSKGMKFAHENSLGNIRQFIEAYNLLKENQNKILDEKRKMVLYLTNKSDKPYILVDSKDYTQEEKESLYDLLNKIVYEDISDVKCSEILHDIEIYKVSNDIMKVKYLKLDNNALLVLNANIINNDEKASTFIFSNEVKFIKSVIELSSNATKLNKIYEAQDKIRKEIFESLI